MQSFAEECGAQRAVVLTTRSRGGAGLTCVLIAILAAGCEQAPDLIRTDSGTGNEVTATTSDPATTQPGMLATGSPNGSQAGSQNRKPPPGAESEPDAKPGQEAESEPGAEAGENGAMAEASAEPEMLCEPEGGVRCSPGGGRSMDVCEGGAWSPADPCAEGEVCSLEEDSGSPTCIAVAEICQGSAGQKVCDGGGVMYTCDERGVVEDMAACASARHCQEGLELGTCPVCLAGTEDEFICDGAELMRCSDASDGYLPTKTCETESLCNAVAGDCTDAACSPGQKVCDGDVLKQCNADQTALEELMTCEPGLCDAEAGACDACVPGVAECDDDSTALVCNDDGTQLVRTPCPSSTPACGGAGMCLECGKASDCGRPKTCHAVECTAGACASPPLSSGTCSGSFGDGYCVRGSCVECRSRSDCGASEPCHRWQCNSNRCQSVDDDSKSCTLGGKSAFCSGGDCVECRSASDCGGSAGTCHKWQCNSNRSQAVEDDSKSCTLGGKSAYCSGGDCVQCRNASDCDGSAGTCHKWQCSSNSCRAVDDNSKSCTLGGKSAYCSGGECVQCRNPSDCGQPETCHKWQCSSNNCNSVVDDSRTCRLDGKSAYCSTGDCVQCRSPSDCPDPDPGNPCKVASCSSNGGCGSTNASTSTRCDTGFCDGRGGCRCRNDSDCPGSNVCEGGACVRPVCGDGITNGTEECDDGNGSNTDDCINCKRAKCGDGYIHAQDEECDPDASGWDSKSCSDSACRIILYESCMQTTQCHGNYLCDFGGCFPPAPASGVNCSIADDCPTIPGWPRAFCGGLGGSCILRCANGNRCPAGLTCTTINGAQGCYNPS